MNNKPYLCAWLSQHEPRPRQIESLREYHIVRVHPFDRFQSAQDAVVCMEGACARYAKNNKVIGSDGQPHRGYPDLIMVVMSRTMLHHFLPLVRSPVIRAQMIPRLNAEPEWSGKWDLIHKVEIVTTPWSP